MANVKVFADKQTSGQKQYSPDFLGSSNSEANKDMISKIWTNGDTIIWLKTLWEKEKFLQTRNFSFSHNVFKSCLLLMCQNEYLWSKE